MIVPAPLPATLRFNTITEQDVEANRICWICWVGSIGTNAKLLLVPEKYPIAEAIICASDWKYPYILPLPSFHTMFDGDTELLPIVIVGELLKLPTFTGSDKVINKSDGWIIGAPVRSFDVIVNPINTEPVY
jgi:hypothetical protein